LCSKRGKFVTQKVRVVVNHPHPKRIRIGRVNRAGRETGGERNYTINRLVELLGVF